MKNVIEGKIYNTETATLIASDHYWDGSNFDRNGRNTYLYRTPRGAYFLYHTTRWSGENDTIQPIEIDEAISTYGELREKDLSYEDAFDAVPEEPEPKRGRPPMYDSKLLKTALWLPEHRTTLS